MYINGLARWRALDCVQHTAHTKFNCITKITYSVLCAQQLATTSLHQPRSVEDNHVSHLAHLQRTVGLRQAKRSCCVDGGGSEGLGHGEAQVDTGQMHHKWLKTKEKEGVHDKVNSICTPYALSALHIHSAQESALNVDCRWE